MYINPLTAIDFYKADHRRQYPEGTELVYSNFTARSAKHAIVNSLVGPDYDHKVVFFGLQGFCWWFLQEMWQSEFFRLPQWRVVGAYQRRMDTSLGKGAIPVEHIQALHKLGYLPISIKALPEGTRVPIGVPMFTVENTIPEFYWLTNYLETVISNSVWKSCTTATLAYEFRKLFLRYAKETGASLEFVDIQGHDFSCRGMSGIHDAATAGAGHLLSFVGTDTVSAIDYAERYYFGPVTGISVPATEHSVMSMGGKEDEIASFRRLIGDIYPSGFVSIVSDTWDFYNVVGNYARTLRAEILARNGRVVFRPDSGDPVKIICGDPEAKDPLERKGAVEVLWEIFGGTSNPQGYRTLNPHVGLIYGDSITYSRANAILSGLKSKGFASDNVVFGIGSFTYQHVTRDTFGFAIKSTFGKVKGESRELFKDPKTDDGTKRSLRGLVKVVEQEGELVVLDRQPNTLGTFLNPIFKNGLVIGSESFEVIKRRLIG